VNNWRRSYAVLVTDAHTIGGLGTIRSLGRAGFRVIGCSPQADAIGFHSRYCDRARVQPSFADHKVFIAWLEDIMASEQVRLIIPSESFLLAVRPYFAQLSALLPVPQDESLAYRGLSKWDLFKICAEGGLAEHLPPFHLIDEHDGESTAREFRGLDEPIFLKVDAAHAREEGDSAVIRCATREIALDRIRTVRRHYRRVLVQGYVPGIGVGAFLARWRGSLLGEFMHRRIHEVPHTGGASSFRAAWRHPAIISDAHARANLLRWEGVGMFEYRWNAANDRFYLMEFNARFWRSLHLALFAGVDFPRLLADAFFNHPDSPVTDYSSIRCRLTFPTEVEYVWSCLKDTSLPWARRLWPVLEFGLLGLDPTVYSDLNYRGDRMLYWRMMLRSIRRFLA
jgi:predicted ATP-grasp superfamily ATP-dependent carboligase